MPSVEKNFDEKILEIDRVAGQDLQGRHAFVIFSAEH